MFTPSRVSQAAAPLRQVSAALIAHPGLEEALRDSWMWGSGSPRHDLNEPLRLIEHALGQRGPLEAPPAAGPEAQHVWSDAIAPVLLVWCEAHLARADVHLADLLLGLAALPKARARALDLARERLVQGPAADALCCVPLIEPKTLFGSAHHAQARARWEILIWEAGACAEQLPNLGAWLWSSPEAFHDVVVGPARGTLRGRVYAARCLEVAVCGIPASTDPALLGDTLKVLQPLLLHPEALVWVHAARCFGRLAGAFEPLEGTLLDWVHGASSVLRQRALTAFASLPAARLAVLGHELESIIDARESQLDTLAPRASGPDLDQDTGVLAAVAAATPYLFYERKPLWDRLAERILAGDGGPAAVRSLARGLGTLWRRGRDRPQLLPIFRRVRSLAQRPREATLADWRQWLDALAATDPLDEAERDPLDVERGLGNLIRLAAQYDDEEADARAARFAGTLAPNFLEAKRVVLHAGSARRRASALNALEGCARALALRLWAPMLATHPDRSETEEPPLAETWSLLAGTPEELLDLVRTRRQDDTISHDAALALEILSLNLGGYVLDAVGQGGSGHGGSGHGLQEHESADGRAPASAAGDLGPGAGRGPTAHATCLWLRKLDGLQDGSRTMPAALQSALSALFWRLVDTTRGTALGEVDDVEWLGPFSAWWALVIDRPAALQQLATALPMIAEGALETCCLLADHIRETLETGQADGAWQADVERALASLKADRTELAASLSDLAAALTSFGKAAGPRPDLDAQCLTLAIAAERLRRALNDPVHGLHPAGANGLATAQAAQADDNATRMAIMVARAVRSRKPALLDVWFASLGPVTGKLVEGAVAAAVRRTPPPPPQPPRPEPKTVMGYQLVTRLGEGGVGSVWLVRKPDADRLFVLKVPKKDALESASDTEREGILASFKDEAKALAELYHPNVANIIDRGVHEGMPYLVLEYLVGADLRQYAKAQRMSLFELRKVVVECCAGLAALHNAGLVHRDIKPANLWLRLPLASGERFDGQAHRDPAVTTPLATVIIDFGMVRAQRVAPEVGGRFVAGTTGYLAPEQVLDPVHLDGRADVYALAGTIYNVTSGRAFFDDISDARERIIAHMQRDPMEDLSRFRDFPAALVKLMREATAREWADRPTPLEFSHEFVAIM